MPCRMAGNDMSKSIRLQSGVKYYMRECPIHGEVLCRYVVNKYECPLCFLEGVLFKISDKPVDGKG